MKKLLFVLMILIAAPFIGIAKPKNNLPFAPKAKYGKLRTKQARPVKQKQAWIYKQWGR